MILGLTLGLGNKRGRVPAAPSFNPASLFGVGDQGVVYEPNPANCGVSVGAGVATMTDTSGKGNNATQATAGNRPLLWQSGAYYGLDFDGTDDWLQTAAINMTATDQMTVIVGITKDTNTPAAVAVEFSANCNTNNGSFLLVAPSLTGSGANYSFATKGAGAAILGMDSGTILAPGTRVLTNTMELVPANRALRVNGTQVNSSTLSAGTGNFGNYPLYLGRRGGTTLPFNGRLHALIIINRVLSGADLTNAEAWVTARTPV